MRKISETFETELNKTINFLDIKITLKSEGLDFDWYIKPTSSGRFIDFNSSHPKCHKVGLICHLVDKAVKLSDKEFHDKNLEIVKKILYNNNFPKKFVLGHIKKRLFNISNKNNNPTEPSRNFTPENILCVPYIEGLSERLNKICSKHNINVVYSVINQKNSKLIIKGKDNLPKDDRINLVYKIECDNCPAVYVGQTKRKISSRIREHFNNISHRSQQISVVSEHRLEKNHDFRWNDVKILDNEPNWKKRLISEMIHIKTNTFNINKRQDTEGLNPLYDSLLKKLLKLK